LDCSVGHSAGLNSGHAHQLYAAWATAAAAAALASQQHPHQPGHFWPSPPMGAHAGLLQPIPHEHHHKGDELDGEKGR